MPSSGGGTGTPVVVPDLPTVVYDQQEELLLTPNCAVSLARYAKLIHYEEAAFWGVVWDNQFLRGCDPLWSEYERMSIQNSLAEAQQEIEEVLAYPLCPTYVSGTFTADWRWVDQQHIRINFWGQMLTRYPRVLAAGIQAVTMVDEDSPVDYSESNGVGVVGPLATASINTQEIKIFYPDSDREITPSKITISAGFVTIEIPRYRMVRAEFLDQSNENPVRYENINFFLSTVDVRRIYTDPSTQAVFVRPGCRNGNCAGGCSECTQAGCIYIRDPFLGIVNVTPGVWDGDAFEWSSRRVCTPGYSEVRLNYLSGVNRIDLKAEMAVIRLAHAKMGRPPCACDKTGAMWQKDYDVTGAITRERVNCPFGLSNGAWNAYRWALTSASKRASIL